MASIDCVALVQKKETHLISTHILHKHGMIQNFTGVCEQHLTKTYGPTLVQNAGFLKTKTCLVNDH